MANILYDNCFISNHRTKVKEVVEENGYYWHHLEETIFFAEGGGMLSDRGLINQHKVLKLKKENEIVWHLLDVKLEGSVILSIDFHRRLLSSQIHTAQHLISGLMRSIYGIETLSHHVHDKYNDIVFDGKEFSERALIELQMTVNGMIRDDYPVTIFYPTKQEAMKYTSKDLSMFNEVRIVKIGDVFSEPCGCIHVPSLRFIQMIKLTEYEVTNKGLIIRYVCGDQMLKNYDLYHTTLNKATTLLAQPVEFVEMGILKLIQEIKNLNADNLMLKHRYVIALCEKLNQEGNVYHFFDDIDLKTFAMLCNSFKELHKGLFIFVLKHESRVQLFVGNDMDSDVIFNKIASKLNLKGGGNKDFAQGGGVYTPEVEEVVLDFIK